MLDRQRKDKRILKKLKINKVKNKKQIINRAQHIAVKIYTRFIIILFVTKAHNWSKSTFWIKVVCMTSLSAGTHFFLHFFFFLVYNSFSCVVLGCFDYIEYVYEKNCKYSFTYSHTLCTFIFIEDEKKNVICVRGCNRWLVFISIISYLFSIVPWRWRLF